MDSTIKITRVEWLEKRISEVQRELKYGGLAPVALPDRKGYLHDLKRELAKAKNNICPTCHGEGLIL